MFPKLQNIFVALALSCVLSSCITTSMDGITQVATIDALLTGVYDGHMSLRELRSYGDFGIGTFEGLDGEMILLNGSFYKVRADGKVYKPFLSERTPFASVTKFIADQRESIDTPTDMKAMESRLDSLVPQQNKFCAFAVHGRFSRVRTRSVPSQKKPYPPLSEVTKTQSVFAITNVTGTMMGFRCPPFVKGVNVPGYHLHFLADDRSGGGHVLAFDLTQGVLEADTVHEWLHLYLPTESASFGAADLTQDRAATLQNVEKSGGGK